MIVAKFLFPAFIFVALVGCQVKESQNSLSEILNSGSITLKEGISLRNEGRYQEAIPYFRMDGISNATVEEREFGRLNTLLCSILNAEVKLKGPDATTMYPLQPLTWLVRGINEYYGDETGLESLHKAQAQLHLRGLNNSFYQLLAYEYLGLAHWKMGRYNDSAAYYFKQSQRIVQANPALAANTPRILSHLAMVSLINRDQMSGLGYVAEALGFPVADKLKAALLIDRGTMLRKLKLYDSCEKSYNAAEAILLRQKNTDSMLKLLRERALLSVFLKDSVSFFSLMDRIHALVKENPVYLPQESRLWGYFYLNRDDVEQSIFHYHNAWQGFKRQKFPDVTLLMESLYVLTEQYQQLKQFEQAEQAAYNALVALTPASEKPYTWENVLHPDAMDRLYNFINYDLLAGVFLARYKSSDREVNRGIYLQKALRLYKVIDSLMWFQVRVTDEDAMLRFLNVGNKIYSGAVEACYLAYAGTQQTHYLQSAHQYMERSKALILYRDIFVNDESYFPYVPRAFRDKELHIKRKVASAKTRKVNGVDGLSEAIKEMDQYYEAMQEQYPEYYAAKYQATIPGFDYYRQLALEQDKSIVQYLFGTDNMYVLTYDDPPRFLQIPLTPEFLSRMEAMKKLIRLPVAPVDTVSVGQFYQQSTFLHSQLVVPLGDLKAEILIVPDGPLNDFPFDVLAPTAAGSFALGDFLVREHNITYAHSLKTSSMENARSIVFKRVLAFAYSPENDQKPISQWPQLRGAVTELQHIRRYFDSGATLKFGLQASKESFLDNIEKPYDIVHLALHATSSATNRLDNKIYFPNGTLTDDIIYGHDLISKRSNARLVMITACESGYGTDLKGEGTYSLIRAFRQSGAEFVVGSLWGLPDFSSAQLIDQFYSGIKTGQSPPVALGAAKRDFLSHADTYISQPFYWAGLVAYGH